MARAFSRSECESRVSSWALARTSAVGARRSRSRSEYQAEISAQSAKEVIQMRREYNLGGVLSSDLTSGRALEDGSTRGRSPWSRLEVFQVQMLRSVSLRNSGPSAPVVEVLTAILEETLSSTCSSRQTSLLTRSQICQIFPGVRGR